jgi:hypothetical protein
MRRVTAFLISATLLAAPAFARGGGHGGHGGGGHGGGHRGGGHTRSTHVKVQHPKTKTSATTNPGKVQVKGYVTKKGTHVDAHDRTRSNQTKSDNWSTKGNVNPETGKAGTKPPTGKSHH